MRRYEKVNEILNDFYTLRLEYYVKRKDYLVDKLRAEVDRLSDQDEHKYRLLDLTILKAKTPEDLWEADLDTLEVALDKMEIVPRISCSEGMPSADGVNVVFKVGEHEKMATTTTATSATRLAVSIAAAVAKTAPTKLPIKIASEY